MKEKMARDTQQAGRRRRKRTETRQSKRIKRRIKKRSVRPSLMFLWAAGPTREEEEIWQGPSVTARRRCAVRYVRYAAKRPAAARSGEQEHVWLSAIT